MRTLLTNHSRIFKLFLLLLISQSLSLHSIHAQGAAMAGMTVNQIVDNFADRIDQIISDLDDVITKQSFDVRSHLQIVLQQTDYIVDKNIDKTFDRLSETQQNLFVDINNTIEQFERTGQVLITDVDKLLNKGVALIGTLPGSRRAPVITALSPTYYGNTLNQDVAVRIDGAWLAKGEPYLEFDDEKYRPTTKIDSRLEFLIPLDLLNDSSRVNLEKAELTVYKKRLFGKKEQKYTLGFYLVPEMMGTYSLSIKNNTQDTLYESRAGRFAHRNGHCWGSRRKNWAFNSTGPEWKIDLNTVRLEGVHVSSKSSRPLIENLTRNGFRVSATVTNNGTCCPKVFGSRPCRDGRGSVNGTARWTEYRTVPRITELREISSGKLFWNTELNFDLGNNLNSFVLEVVQLNGEKKVITGQDLNKWFEVKFSRISNFLEIEPNSLSSALN